MNMRGFLTAAGLSALAALVGRIPDGFAGAPGEATPFDWNTLNERAKALAAAPFNEALYQVPPGIANLNYDQYRFIHFNPDKAIWSHDPLNFRLQLFHGGYIYKEPVDLFILEGGM